MLRRYLVLAASCAFCVGVDAADLPKSAPAKQASFHINTVFTIKVPRGAKTVRAWYAIPQEDNHSVIRNFTVASDYPIRYERDSWGNKVGYTEIQNPTQEQITLKEEFDLTRSEVVPTGALPETSVAWRGFKTSKEHQQKQSCQF